MIRTAHNSTNTTPKIGASKGKYSLHAPLQELEAQEEIRLEELLQDVQTLEDYLQDLPSLEDHLAETERLIEQVETKLEEYLKE